MFRTLLKITSLAALACSANAATDPLAGAPVRVGGAQSAFAAEGSVEAVRQSTVSSQVAGVILQLAVKPGDKVKAGQLLASIDARAARQTAAAGGAQVDAARAELEVAGRDFARQQQLFEQKFISQAALDRAEAQYKTARAQAGSLRAQADAAITQAGYFTVSAQYAGLVSDIPAMPGDMALPGRTLLTMYDPAQMRVTVNVPQEVVASLLVGQPVKIELPGLAPALRWQTATSVSVLPAADAGTHTVQVRLDLPATPGLVPGMYARALLPTAAGEDRRLYVPAKAVFRRAELTAVYILNEQGAPLLRQVRPGPKVGEEIEILSGVAAGERVALDPLAAAKLR